MSGCSRYAQAVCELNFKQVWISFDNRFRLAFALLLISVPWRPKGRRRAHAVRCKHVGIHEFWIGKRSTSMTRVKQEHNRKHTENAIGCYLATGRLTVLQTVQLITCYENISGVAFCCCFCSHSSMALLYIYYIYTHRWLWQQDCQDCRSVDSVDLPTIPVGSRWWWNCEADGKSLHGGCRAQLAWPKQILSLGDF